MDSPLLNSNNNSETYNTATTTNTIANNNNNNNNMSESNTVADGYSRTDQRIPIATSTTPVAPPLDFDYNDGVAENFDNIQQEDDSYDNESRDSSQIRAGETGVDRHLAHPDHPHLEQTHEGEHRYDHGDIAS